MLKKILLITVATLCSFSALADFEYPGKGTLTYPTGTQKKFAFGFAFKKGPDGQYFQVGEQKMSTDEVPQKYSIWLTLHQDKYVWVQEFSKGYFEGFDWQLGKHHITLKKKLFDKKRAKADYVLNIDGYDYFFSNTNGQIEIEFNNKGIKVININGFVKDIGMKK
jgi:uncharacterized protein YdeI (BOF family)